MKTIKLFTIILTVICSFSSCTLYRGIIYGAPGIDDYKLFVNDTIKCGNDSWHFAKGSNRFIDSAIWTRREKGKIAAKCALDSLFTYSKSTAFVVIRNDSVLLERYYKGRKREDVSTVYSVSKTLTCMLATIAIDEGAIGSIDDPVRKYFPELGSKRDTMFNSLTIRHLMDMRAGIKHPENYGWDPFSKLGRLFYGRNAMGQMKKLKLENEPGKKHDYQSVSTEILGVVIERATGKPLAQYMQDKVWQPLGMEHNAFLSLDSKKKRVPKAFGGFAVSAIDLAKIGRLYLNNGNWNGKQIIDSSWVKIARTPNAENYGYQLSWYSVRDVIKDTTNRMYFADDSLSVVKRITELKLDDAGYRIFKVGNKDRAKVVRGKWYADKHIHRYYALGILGQIMLLDPKNNTILIRLGHDDNFDDYESLLNKVAGNL